MNKPEIKSELSKNTDPSAEHVEKWKEAYGKIRRIKLQEEGEPTMYFYYKKISLQALKLAVKSLNDGDRFKYSEIVLKEALLNGHDYLEDSEVFLALAAHVDTIVSTKVASIEKNLETQK